MLYELDEWLKLKRSSYLYNLARSVFVKGVVRQVHAASLVLRAPVSRSGFSQTGPAGAQLRGCLTLLPDSGPAGSSVMRRRP